MKKQEKGHLDLATMEVTRDAARRMALKNKEQSFEVTEAREKYSSRLKDLINQAKAEASKDELRWSTSFDLPKSYTSVQPAT